jgi:O-antigen/teichoic acid export membrane protein
MRILQGFGKGFIIFSGSTAAALIFYEIYRIFPNPIRRSLPWKLFPKLAKIGISLMSAGLLYNLLITVDHRIILGHLGIKELGEFTLPILVFSTISLISLLFLPLIGGVGNFLNVIDKQIYYLLVQAVAG